MSVVRIEREGGIAVVTIDNPPVNASSQAVREALLQAIAQTNGDAANRTDVFIAPQVSATSLVAAKANRAASAVKFIATPKLRARVNANLTWALREGPPGKRD